MTEHLAPSPAADRGAAPRLIGLDWGTSSCRAYLLDGAPEDPGRAALRLGWRSAGAVEQAAPRGLWLTARTAGLLPESS